MRDLYQTLDEIRPREIGVSANPFACENDNSETEPARRMKGAKGYVGNRGLKESITLLKKKGKWKKWILIFVRPKNRGQQKRKKF
ncbi:hypothetical protein AVEN_245483-1 [Araneus ventricosus]|uniref:Uncharacterized protein n=1 Tax=Araneus ventricosus TaxID=182803 RepID=A0A4Y2D7M7_ARAVE|nr:hypothetical protein AVEN_245483-1 [Araneus ventricosus]